MIKGHYTSGKFNQRICDYFKCENGLLSDKALRLAADKNGTVYIGTDCGLNYTKKDGSFGSFACGEIGDIFAADDGSVYFSSEETLYAFRDGKISEIQTFDDKITGINGESEIYLTTAAMLYKLEDGRFTEYCGTEMPSQGLSAGCGKMVSFSGRCLAVFAGKRKHWRCLFSDHCGMPDCKINCAAFDKKLGFLWLGTDKGAFIYDNRNNWFGSQEINALPAEEIFSIHFGENGKIVMGSSAGVVVIQNGSKKYLPATRWACEEKVNAVVSVGNEIWTATDSGVTRITEREMTLKEKADYCFEYAEKHNVRRGFVLDRVELENCDINTGIIHISDNDGLWTHTYLSALCYCYAVTKDEKVLEAARTHMNAMALLTKISGIKGFTARAVRYEGEQNYGILYPDGGDGGEWHKAPDGTTEWLGETSSDEMTGHFTGFSLYYDMCANEEEKAVISEIIRNIVDHIIEHKYRLHDFDDLPTTWACWDPDELNRNDMWMWEKCINSLEILTFLSVAYHVTGDEKYHEEYMRLAIKEHYLLNAAQHKKIDGRVTHIDDNLGFLCTLTILRLEKDPAVRAYLLMGLKHFWDYERIEGNALYNLIYGVFADDCCDIDTAIKYLRDLPIDFVNREVYNRNRKGLVFDSEPERWTGHTQLARPLDADQKPLMNNDTNPFCVNGGNNKRSAVPHIFLLPYWFGRYYGIIDEEN